MIIPSNANNNNKDEKIQGTKFEEEKNWMNGATYKRLTE